MHCSRKDIARWKRAAKLRKSSAQMLEQRKRMNEKAKKLWKKIDPNAPKIIRVIKLDGTVQIIEVKKQQ